MQLPRKSVLAGVPLGLIPVVLGVVGIVTPEWINLSPPRLNGTYGLFSCNNILCRSKPEFRVVQGLEIAGVAAIAVGMIIAVFLDIFTKKRWIHLFPQIFLFTGPTAIFIGLLLYAKSLFEDITKLPSIQSVTLVLGYSIILIIIACPLGFLTAIYFSFVAGFGRYLRSPRTDGVEQLTERF
jgi:hypothetical protein